MDTASRLRRESRRSRAFLMDFFVNFGKFPRPRTRRARTCVVFRGQNPSTLHIYRQITLSMRFRVVIVVFRALTPVRPASWLQAALLRGPFGGYLTKIESTFARLRRYRGSISPSSTECAGHCVKPVGTGVARFSLCSCQGVGSTF